MLGYAGIYFASSMLSKLNQKPAKITFESKAEEEWVHNYVKVAKEESHKPELARKSYQGPSGVY
jgi:hypothetical protein